MAVAADPPRTTAVYLIFPTLIRFFLVSLPAGAEFSAEKPSFWMRKLHITTTKCAYFAELKTRFRRSLPRVAALSTVISRSPRSRR